MQLTRIFRVVLKAFVFKFVALVVTLGGFYLVSKVINSDAFDGVGLFTLFFTIIYFLVWSLGWGVTYTVYKSLVRNRFSIIGVLVTWLFYYILVFSLSEHGPPSDHAYHSLRNWIDRIGINVLKTLPVLGLFLLFVRKDFVKILEGPSKNKDPSILDADL